jgi:hypothetical protein
MLGGGSGFVNSTPVATLGLALGLLVPHPVLGQDVSIPRSQPSLSSLQWSAPAFPSEAQAGGSGHGLFGDGSHDYRYPGLYVGVGAGVALSIWAFSTQDGESHTGSLLIGSVLVTAILGVAGALLGSAFHR